MQDFTKLTKNEQEELLNKVYEAARFFESNYGCCSQCVLGSMYDVFGIGDTTIFKSASGFGGGTGLTSQNSCGALAGSVMLIGWICGRTYENLDKGRAEKCYRLSKKVLDYFVEKYDGPLCKDVQNCIMGRSYDLSDPEENEKFIKAGGHDDKCPIVCAETCQYLAEMLFCGELSE